MVIPPEGRWPEIDGLRAAAIIPVLLFHLDVAGFSLGWAGVNLFFVISGFLITGILLDSRADGHYFRNFYVRRALRIFPIYYLLFGAIFAWALFRGADTSDAGYYAFYLQNIPLGAGDWSSGFPSFFMHTWSLAVEEQFYWLWPLVVWRAGPRTLSWIVGLLFTGALAWRCYAQAALEGVAWFSTPLLAQMDAIAAGAAVALLMRSDFKGRLKELAVPTLGIAMLMLGAIVWQVGYEEFWRPDRWVPVAGSPLVYTALALLSAALLVLAIHGVPGLSALLRSPPLRHVGIISYGLYLYHYPAFAALDALAARMPDVPAAGVMDAAKLAVTYVIALVSWHLLERPVLDLKGRLTKREVGTG